AKVCWWLLPLHLWCLIILVMTPGQCYKRAHDGSGERAQRLLDADPAASPVAASRLPPWRRRHGLRAASAAGEALTPPRRALPAPLPVAQAGVHAAPEVVLRPPRHRV